MINLLVFEAEYRKDPKSAPTYRTPIVGDIDSYQPTSSAVHLYIDPTTESGKLPILYADSEGLKSGEVLPLAFRERSASTEPSVGRSPSGAQTRYGEGRLRKATIESLYQRYLYTFSDVLVFVVRNPRYVMD